MYATRQSHVNRRPESGQATPTDLNGPNLEHKKPGKGDGLGFRLTRPTDA
ncbi:unnamed protein product [Spirodela intermedia]|uniref:Uncharacterized protein n=1 Tax=Spirodela intermedia TaxID=51605 RepID=A0A7I8JYL7_SPIIN|nr:unnamed protein product [Spirodela intermedia]